MKNFVKYFATFLAMAGLLAAEVVSGTFASGITSLYTNGVSISNIQLTDTSAAANTVVVYDNDSSTSTNRVYAAYTGVVQYTTNIVMSFTNFTGVAQSYTNTVLKTDNITVAAATNQARRVFTFRLPASGTVTFTPNYPAGTTFGLQLSATGAGGYNANVQPLGIQ
jgi:hypothetical protein